ncbi:OmpA family protein [Pseudanabaena mucicola]|uniref:TonB-dependent receptor n=1 Tax=Pseudanabaena mucicola FACHB-723 TaxID=2692860 RepID=A0ABR8A0B8_9CYAN|nr:OmpA family protein [Pseudanabaena mucicola]MBD2189073.1 TonB-dependent receptor [Pseudanabaena mucicola FACHB-723]
MKRKLKSFPRIASLVIPQILLMLMTTAAHANTTGLSKDQQGYVELNSPESLINQDRNASQSNDTPPIVNNPQFPENTVVSSIDKTTDKEIAKPAISPAINPSPVPETNPNLDKNTITSPTAQATTKQSIVILSPTIDTVLDVPAATVVIQMPLKTKVELLVNGKAVDASSIGRLEVDEANQTVTQTWYGVPLQAGNNTVSAKAIGGDSSILDASVNLKVRGTPVKLVIKTLESRIPADGRSFATVDGQLVDENNNRSNWDAVVTLETNNGEFIGTDFSPEQPGFQVQAKQGKFTAQLKSGLSTGSVTIRAVTSQMEAFTQVQFETDLRPSLVTGVIDLRVGARGTDFYRSLREFLPVDRDNRTQVDLYGAVFGTGRVGEWLVTGAFNNSRTLSQDCAGNSSLFTGEKYCDPQYPVTGDSSTSSLTTPSFDSLYLRVERNSPVQGAGTDYLMWGNFNTEEFTSRSQQYSGLSRQLQGLKGNFNLGDLQITGFYSNVGKSFQRDTIAPNGTSGTYFLSKRFLINGSENVVIELIDFFSAGTVIARQQLSRGKDYDIDYDSGSLLFRQPLLQTDLDERGNLLRRQIVVTYQNEEVGGDSSIYGGQLRYNFNRSQSQPSWLTANYFKESLGVRNFVLYGTSALISLGDKTQLIAEYARSQNDSELLGYVSGSAFRFDLNSEVAPGILTRLYYNKTETGFTNNATTSFVPGQTRYGAQVNAKLGSTTSVKLQYDQEDNLGVAPRPLTSLADLLNQRQEAVPGSAVDNSLRTISVGLQQNLGAALLNLDLLYRDRIDRQPPNFLTSNSTQLRSRLSVPITDSLRLNAQNEVSISASADAVIPDRTVVTLDWTIVQGVTARLGQQWFQSGPLAGKAITSADLIGEYKLGTDTSFTGRYSFLTGDNTNSTQGALGFNQRWQIVSGLRLAFGYEHIFGSFATTTPTGTQFLQPVAVGQSSSSLTLQNGNSYNIGLEYTDNPDFKASARFEHRSDNTSSNSVFNASALGKLSPALTMLFNYQQSSAANQALAGLGTISSLKVGLAYRDPNDDRLNVLMRYEYRQNPSIVPESLISGAGNGYNDHTFAIEAIYAPDWQWEFYGKLALRNSTTQVAQDFIANSITNLTQFRVSYRLNYNLELVGEGRFLAQPTAGYSELGLVGEVGYYLTPNLRLAVGYSSGSINADRDFSGTRSAGGLYAGLTVKLNELFDGFGLQKMPPRQQQEPIDPQTPVAQVAPPAQKVATAAIPNLPQSISLNVSRSLTFKNSQSNPNSTDLSVADIAVLENLASVLKEYKNISIDIQGYMGSLADMNSGDNLAANRMIAARKYLLDRGVTGSQMTLRSLGGVAASAEPANLSLVSFALNGKADVFNAIANRLQASTINSPAAEFLQSILPDSTSNLQANATNAPINPAINKSTNISLGINVDKNGQIADLSYASIDRLIERLKTNPNATIELQTSSVSSNANNLEMFKLLAVRTYLLDKGINSDRILLSTNTNTNINPTDVNNSPVYISLSDDDSTNTIATTPTVPATQADARTTPVPMANANTVNTPLALLMQDDLNGGRRLSSRLNGLGNWLESTLPNLPSNDQLTLQFSETLSFSELGLNQLLTQIPTELFLAAIINPDNIIATQDDVPVTTATATTADRRLATAFNFLLTGNGDVVTAFIRALEMNDVAKTGFAIPADQLPNLKN